MNTAERKMRLPIFVERITQLRDEYDNNTNFAEAVGLTRQAIGSYINGNRIPDAQILKQIAEKTGVSVDWLLGLSKAKTPDATIQSASTFTKLPEETLEIIKELAENSSYNDVLQIFFYFLQNDEDFLKELTHLFHVAQSSLPVRYSRDLTDSESNHEKAIFKEINKLITELPEHRHVYLLGANRFAESLKLTITNKFQNFLNYLITSATAYCYPELDDIIEKDDIINPDEVEDISDYIPNN